MKARNAQGQFVRPTLKFSKIPSKSDKGERRILSVQVAPDLARRIQDICYEGRATGKFPWDTPGEVHRWLLVKGLEQLHEAIGDSDDVLRFHQLDQEVDRVRTMRTAAQQLFDQIATEVQALVAINRTREAIQLLHLFVPDILKLESVIWREWIIERLKAEFPALLAANMPYAKLITVRPEQVLGPKTKKVDKKKKRR